MGESPGRRSAAHRYSSSVAGRSAWRWAFCSTASASTAVIVEKSPTTTDHPKSRGCWVRTMEIFRQWGIEQRIRDRGLQDNSDIFVQVESIAGREIGRSRPEPNLGQTPAWKCLVAQDAVEEEIYRVIEHSNRVQVRSSTEFVGFEETDRRRRVRDPLGRFRRERALARQVPARMRRRGQPDSPQRRASTWSGPRRWRCCSNEYWRADLSRFPLAREAAGYQVCPDTRRAARRHPQHQRPRPLAQHHPDRPRAGRAAAAMDRRRRRSR